MGTVQFTIGLGAMVFSLLFLANGAMIFARSFEEWSFTGQNIKYMFCDIVALAGGFCSLLAGFVVLIDSLMKG